MNRYLLILETAQQVLDLIEASNAKFPKGPSLGTIGYGVNLDDPRRFVGSQKPLKIRKTDSLGNVIRKPNTKAWSATRKLTQSAIDGANDMIQTLSIKPAGIKIEIMGIKNGQPYSLFIKKIIRMGETIYVSMSGKEVELKAAGTGLQVLDKNTRRIMLDRGMDMLWD